MIGILNLAYLGSSILTGLAGLATVVGSSRRWWLALSAGLLGLCLSRIEQAGVWADDYLRDLLASVGWYGYHRPLQVAWILAFAFALFVLFRVRSAQLIGRPLIAAISSFYALCIFAAIKSSSLHWSDEVLGEQIGPATLSHVIQSLLLLLTSAAAAFYLLSRRRTRNDSRIQ